MRIGIGIMGHHERTAMAVQLARDTKADTIVLDDGTLGENECGDTVWRHLSELDTDWSVVIQDDAVLGADWRGSLERALAVAHDGAVGLYVGRTRPRKERVEFAVARAEAVGAAWLEADTMLWGVGIALPTSHIAGFLEWAATSRLPYDDRIGRFYSRHDRVVRYTWPSIVDHADGESIMDKVSKRRPRADGPRIAHRVGPHSGEPGPVIRIPNAGARFL